jgi:hypothetical protein
MAITTNYPTPVTVNGFSCRNCTDVDYAKQHIDPAHPKDGPYGLDAATPSGSSRSAAVVFGGQLSATASGTPSAAPAGLGGRVNVVA